MDNENNENSQASEATMAAKEKLEARKRAKREQQIADEHFEKMSKRAARRGKTLKKPKPVALPSVEEPITTPTPESETEAIDDVVDDVVDGKARGKEALKQIAKASTMGIQKASKTIGSEVLSPLLSMAILTEAPLLAAGLDKSISALKTVSGGIFGFAKKAFFKDKQEDPPTEENVPNKDDLDDFQFNVIDVLEEINDNIILGNELFIGLIEGLSDGVKDFQNDMMKANIEKPNNDAFLASENALESKNRDDKTIVEKPSKENSIKAGGFLGFLPNKGMLKKAGSLIMKITGISFVLGVIKSLTPFGKSKEGKAASKGLKGLGKRFGKMFKMIMKPLRFLAGPLMTVIRVAFMGLVAVLGTISAPVLAIIAVIAAIVAGVVLLARKLGDGDILKGFGVMWDYIKDFFNMLWVNLKDGFGSVLGFVTGLPSKVFGGMKEAFDTASDSIKTKSMEFIDYITAIPTKILGWIKSQVEKIPVIGKLFKEGENDTKKVVSKVVGGAGNAVKNLKNSAERLGTSALESVGKVVNKTLERGKQLPNIIKSLKESGGEAKEIIQRNSTEFVSNLTKGFLLPFKSIEFMKRPSEETTITNNIGANNKLERQNEAFMTNMTRTRENDYYSKIAGSGDKANDVSVNTQNNSTYNTTNVLHKRSGATMPKPINMGY